VTGLKGQIIFAPVDTQKDSLKVLDVGCVDDERLPLLSKSLDFRLRLTKNADCYACIQTGNLLRDLAKQLKPSAELVGADVMPSFLPKENPSGNIRYVLQDVCELFASGLLGRFDLTNVRFVLAGAAPGSLNTAVANLASSLAPGG
jgi:hypothetical protein